ncbi:MAG: hypothetical protein QOJ98_2926 [Acidobacteriota bacterium]|jgi:hypothetical protein|nr:hypothetical protein [Acidobacteriota bacterium]
MKRKVFAAVGLLLAILVAGGALLVRRTMNRGFQINTAARMKALCQLIEQDTKSMTASEAASRARQIIASRYEARDAWQQPLVFMALEDGQRLSYILVSLGSDGKADRPLQDYFSYPKRDIRGYPQSDIVFRDGDWITNAFK